MLAALGVPNAMPPEVPSAQPGAPAGGDERNGFAQLLQRAHGEPDPAPEVAHGKSPAPKAHRGDTPMRGSARTEHKAPDPGEPAGLAACTEGDDRTGGIEPLHDSGVASLPAAIDDTAIKKNEPVAIAATPIAAPESMMPMPVPRSAEPIAGAPPAPQLPNEDALASGCIGLRFGAHDIKPPQRSEPGATAQTDAASAHDVSRGLTVVQAQAAQERTAVGVAANQSARVAQTPIERSPMESINPAAAAIHGAREVLSQTVARADAPTATLRAPIDHPALAAQVTLWVRDGVQEARLQLHPAELGPVTVQIALEGKAAHVDFTAAVAATRDSIEQSLPALAAALRESGLTLAGGGVFGRSGQGAGEQDSRQRSPAGRGARMAAISEAADAALAAAPRRWARSLLDVYA